MHRTQAVVLRRVDFSETSQVVHFFTLDAGKVHAIAKGAKRRKSAFIAPFDLFTVYEIVRIEKKRGELDILTAAEVMRHFPALRSGYERYCAACYALDITNELTLEGVPQPDLYELLVALMEELDGGGEIAPAVFRFEVRLTSILGHLPRTAECGLCRQAIRGREAFFSCRDGGAVCMRCKPRDPRRVRIPVEVLGVLKRYGDPGSTVKLNRAWVDPLRRILDDYIRYLAEKEPKSMKFMRKVVLGTVGPQTAGRRP